MPETTEGGRQHANAREDTDVIDTSGSDARLSPHGRAAGCPPGDQAAWEALVRSHAGLVYTVLRRAGLAEEEAADAFQDVWVAARGELAIVRDARAVKGRLTTIAARAAASARPAMRGGGPPVSPASMLGMRVATVQCRRPHGGGHEPGRVAMTESTDRPAARPLRELRAARGLAIRDLARAAGVAPASIVEVEDGRAAAPNLRRAIAAALDVEPAVIAEFGPPPAPAPTSRAARVLIVDDDARLRRLVACVLEDSGHATRTATNGAEALASLPAWRPDLILLDLNMPIMDGRVFCLELERRPAFATIPIVVVSSEATSAAACAPCRPAAFLAKPFSPTALLETIDAVLAGAHPPGCDVG